MAAMRAHPGVAKVQENGCTMLGQPRRQPPRQPGEDRGGGRRRGRGGGDARAPRRGESAGERVHRALAILAANHPANQAKIAEAGGVEGVLAAMRAHPGVAKVQRYGCYALMWLVQSPTVAVGVAKSGAPALVASAARRFGSNTGIQQLVGMFAQKFALPS